MHNIFFRILKCFSTILMNYNCLVSFCSIHLIEQTVSLNKIIPEQKWNALKIIAHTLSAASKCVVFMVATKLTL
jgi:hypothetical protein